MRRTMCPRSRRPRRCSCTGPAPCSAARRMRNAATARLMRVGRATPATPRCSTSTPMALPTMLMRFITMLTRILMPLLPTLRNSAAPALYSARNG